jgi:hypothetical protein
MGAARTSGVTLFLIAAVTGGCKESTTSGNRDLAVPDLSAAPDMAVGKCFSVGPHCWSTSDCGDGVISSCQLGRCCSGVVDPDTCVCHCAGGPPCPGGYLCCTGSPACYLAQDLGILKCRPEGECYPCGPG